MVHVRFVRANRALILSTPGEDPTAIIISEKRPNCCSQNPLIILNNVAKYTALLN